jgi:hypothetical protein
MSLMSRMSVTGQGGAPRTGLVHCMHAGGADFSALVPDSGSSHVIREVS